MSAVVYLMLALLATVIALALYARALWAEVAMLKSRNEVLERAKDAYAAALKRAELTQGVLNDNKREADAKVDDLHSGDALGNALDELRKR